MIKRKSTNNDITQQTKEQATGTLHNTSATIATNNKIMNEKITGL